MRFLLLAVTFVTLAGCATSAPTIQTGPDAETTHDGLVRVDNSQFQRAWVDPTIDLSRYSKIMPGGATFEFRAVRETSASAARRSSANEFYISEPNRQKLTDMANEIFDEELRKSQHFRLVEEPGPDVLVIRGAMLDIVSRVPPDIIGRGEIYIDRVAEATLVLEIVDSTSGETLARAAERGAAQPAQRGMRSSSVTNWSEVRRLIRRWAVRLREGLDAFHQTGAQAD
jgi:hypothetical protein